MLYSKGVPRDAWEDMHAELSARILERAHTRKALKFGIKSWARFQILDHLRRRGATLGVRRNKVGRPKTQCGRRMVSEVDFFSATARRATTDDAALTLDGQFAHAGYDDTTLRDAVLHAVDRLDPRHRFIVYEHYFQGRTNKSIGSDLGLTGCRVSQLLHGMRRCKDDPKESTPGALDHLRHLLQGDPRHLR